MSVAKPLPHDAARLHVTGTARYVDDIPTPTGCLSLAFGLSDVARGTITATNLNAVRAAPGVVAVITADDLPGANDVSPSVHDEPMLADGEVHYLGQPLFLVVAESHLAARKAARLGKVVITPQDPILTIDQALEADSRFEGGPVIWTKGDIEAAFRTAPKSVEGTIEIGGQEHFYLEGQVALAIPGEDGDLLIHSSTQHPTEAQHKVAEALGTPMHSVRVETRRMGGGFGGKESQGNALAVACAVAAAQTGRPCKMRYDRDDDMTITGKRHDFRIKYRAGYGAGGRLLAVEFTQYARCGWSQDLSLPVADRAMLHADNAYDLPAVRIESHRLKTNTQSATAFRGFGGPQGMVGIERVMDHIAHDLGRDPLEVRRVNFYDDAIGEGGASGADGSGEKSDDVVPEPAKLGWRERRKAKKAAVVPAVTTEPAVQTTPYGMAVEDCVVNEIVADLAGTAQYDARRKEIAEWNAKSPILKRGIALTPVKFGISFTLTHLNQAGALVHVYTDGSVHLNHGGTEMGQGLFQKVAQVAADRFGIPIEMVKITATDTAKVPNTSATAASSGTDLNGMAVKAACDEIRDRIADCLADLHQAQPSDVWFEDGHVQVAGNRLTFAAAAGIAYENRVSLSATGFYKTPKVEWDRVAGKGRPFLYFAYGAAISEVVIDTLTGENRILRADILHDAGAPLNPAIDLGQVEGGYVQGAGWLTTEELVWDDKGKLTTHAPSTYKIPAASDRPEVFNVALWEKGLNRENTIFRSKAVGEPPLMLGISVLMALSDAVATGGKTYPALNAPATSEQVMNAIIRVRSE